MRDVSGINAKNGTYDVKVLSLTMSQTSFLSFPFPPLLFILFS